MYYDVKNFGKHFRTIRKKLNLTQKDISRITGVNDDTIRQIENGRVIPKQETLDILSVVMKKDLNQLFLLYRIKDYKKIYKIINKIRKEIREENYITLEKILIQLKQILNENMNTYFSNIFNQISLLVESIIIKAKYNNYEKSLSKLIDAIKITTPYFNLSSYDSYIYSNIEIEILVHVSNILMQKTSIDKSLEIMLYCKRNIDPNVTQLHIDICYNLSLIYNKIEMYNKSLHYTNIGINTCSQDLSLYRLAQLYTNKATILFKLDNNNYIDSFLKAKHLYEILGDDKEIDRLITLCKKKYNINIV